MSRQAPERSMSRQAPGNKKGPAESTSRMDYPAHLNHQREASIRPQPSYRPEQGPFQSQTTSGDSYRQWPVHKTEKPAWGQHKEQYTDRGSYQRPQVVRPKRDEVSFAHPGANDSGKSSYRDEYRQHDCERTKSCKAASNYQPPTEPFNSQSSYRSTYKGDSQERTRSYTPSQSMEIPRGAMDLRTTYDVNTGGSDVRNTRSLAVMSRSVESCITSLPIGPESPEAKNDHHFFSRRCMIYSAPLVKMHELRSSHSASATPRQTSPVHKPATPKPKPRSKSATRAQRPKPPATLPKAVEPAKKPPQARQTNSTSRPASSRPTSAKSPVKHEITKAAEPKEPPAKKIIGGRGSSAPKVASKDKPANAPGVETKPTNDKAATVNAETINSTPPPKAISKTELEHKQDEESEPVKPQGVPDFVQPPPPATEPSKPFSYFSKPAAPIVPAEQLKKKKVPTATLR